jgi:hypothetical protein
MMNHVQAAALHAENRHDRSFLQWLMNPTVDRFIAVIAILPMLWSTRYRYPTLRAQSPSDFLPHQHLCGGADDGVPAPSEANNAESVVLAASVCELLLSSSHTTVHGLRTASVFTSTVQQPRDCGLAAVGVGPPQLGTEHRVCTCPTRNCDGRGVSLPTTSDLHRPDL